MRHRVFLGLGSNIGDRFKHISQALHHIQKIPTCEIQTISSIYETEPVGLKEQNNFLNIVIEIYVLMAPTLLLTKLQNIENEMGRIRFKKWGPRIIDIDILCWENLEIYEIDLIIPHPEIPHRKFVLIPLAEIEPNYKITGFDKDVKTLLEQTTDNSKVDLYKTSDSFIYKPKED